MTGAKLATTTQTAASDASALHRLGPRWRLPDWRSVVETALIVAGVLASLFLLRHGVYADGELRYQSVDQLLRYGVLTNDKYSLIGPLFSIPLWVVGRRSRLPTTSSSSRLVCSPSTGCSKMCLIARSCGAFC